jgi:hypothetical protein
VWDDLLAFDVRFIPDGCRGARRRNGKRDRRLFVCVTSPTIVDDLALSTLRRNIH